MEGLARKFHLVEDFDKSTIGNYNLLPSRFIKQESGNYLLTNEVGEFLFLGREDLEKYVRKKLSSSDPLYHDLKAKHFLYDEDSNVALDLLSLKYRSKSQRVSDFTALHIFVVTLRCDYSCPYCQVSRQTDNKTAYDMSEEVAERSLDLVFESPSNNIKIEFQGGEPTLNMRLIKKIVLDAKKRNETEKRSLGFVVASNLSYMGSDELDFFIEHNVEISTSLDGPQHLHDKNRPRPGEKSYSLVNRRLSELRDTVGPEKVDALMTTTEASLDHPEAIIDEYLRQGFTGIFLRPLSPYGFAVKTRQAYKYDTERWLHFYKRGLNYVLHLNESGVEFVEFYTQILLNKIFSPFGTSYVDLQSPAGTGISALVYNYDGKVFASDEGRMLAEMGDRTFEMGDVLNNTYNEIFLNDTFLDTIEDSLSESSPMCSECAYLQYCGSDPVYHHATQGDVVGHKALSGFCSKNMGMLDHIFSILEEDGSKANILKRWL